MNVAIVLAGGVGTRIGAGIPKQFIEVLGKPILIYTLETLEKSPLIDEIVLVCVESHMDLAKEYCEKYAISKAGIFVSGGKDFTHSCINGMNALRRVCKADDMAVVTVANRPFTSLEEIEDSISVCSKRGSGIAARKCALSMFLVGEDRTHSRNYQRDNLVQTAGPWTFRYGALMDAFDRFEDGTLPSCEPYPLAIYVAAGNKTFFSLAKPRNIKITENVDIALMEQMLKEGENA